MDFYHLQDNAQKAKRVLYGEEGDRGQAGVGNLCIPSSTTAGTIRYPEFRERGWQIGSGPTEAECKTTTQRAKGRGRRWDRQNAEAMMALAALHDSGQVEPTLGKPRPTKELTPP